MTLRLSLGVGLSKAADRLRRHRRNQPWATTETVHDHARPGGTGTIGGATGASVTASETGTASTRAAATATAIVIVTASAGTSATATTVTAETGAMRRRRSGGNASVPSGSASGNARRGTPSAVSGDAQRMGCALSTTTRPAATGSRRTWTRWCVLVASGLTTECTWHDPDSRLTPAQDECGGARRTLPTFPRDRVDARELDARPRRSGSFHFGGSRCTSSLGQRRLLLGPRNRAQAQRPE